MTDDLVKLKEFIDTLFPDSLLLPDEHCLFWAGVSTKPSFPLQGDFDRLAKLLNGKQPRNCYFSTATVFKEPGSGKLFNRQSLFSGLWCIVLDDIGDGHQKQ